MLKDKVQLQVPSLKYFSSSATAPTPPNLTKSTALCPPRASLTFSKFATQCKSTLHLTKAAAIDDDSSSYTDDSFSIAVLKEEKEVVPVSEVDELKKELVYLFYGTNRGLNAASEIRAEIAEVISKLEAKNPAAAPMEALTLLHGKWILAVHNAMWARNYLNDRLLLFPDEDESTMIYINHINSMAIVGCSQHDMYTSFVGLYPLLSSGVLPLLKVEEISQTIDSHNLTVENSVVFSGPLATTSFSINATYQVKSPKRVQIKFEEGVICTPQVTDFITIPDQLQIFGQDIDIPPLKELITYVQDTANSVAKSISSQPPLKFSISHTNAQSWLLTTYLDEDLRVSKLEDGSAFILIKQGSPLLTP